MPIDTTTRDLSDLCWTVTTGQVDGAKARALAGTGPFHGEDGAPWNITRILENHDNPESGPFGQFVFCKGGTDGDLDKEDIKDQEKMSLSWTWDGKSLPADEEEQVLVAFERGSWQTTTHRTFVGIGLGKDVQYMQSVFVMCPNGVRWRNATRILMLMFTLVEKPLRSHSEDAVFPARGDDGFE